MSENNVKNIIKSEIEKQDEVLKAIEIMIEKYIRNRLKNMEYGVITAVNTDGTYAVINKGETFNLKNASGLTLAVNDRVCIFIPNGNYSQRFILCKKP